MSAESKNRIHRLYTLAHTYSIQSPLVFHSNSIHTPLKPHSILVHLPFIIHGARHSLTWPCSARAIDNRSNQSPYLLTLLTYLLTATFDSGVQFPYKQLQQWLARSPGPISYVLGRNPSYLHHHLDQCIDYRIGPSTRKRPYRSHELTMACWRW